MIKNMNPANDNGAENIPVLRRLATIIIVSLGLITLIPCGAALFYAERRSPVDGNVLAAIVGTVVTVVILVAGYSMMMTYLRYAETRKKTRLSQPDRNAEGQSGDDDVLFP